MSMPGQIWVSPGDPLEWPGERWTLSPKARGGLRARWDGDGKESAQKWSDLAGFEKNHWLLGWEETVGGQE